jgi:hypothetical protein
MSVYRHPEEVMKGVQQSINKSWYVSLIKPFSEYQFKTKGGISTLEYNVGNSMTRFPAGAEKLMEFLNKKHIQKNEQRQENTP